MSSRNPWKDEAVNTVLVLVGVLTAAWGISSFLLPAHFIDGGVTGVSMLVREATGISLSMLLPLVNLPFLAVGYRAVGRAFALRSVIAITALAAALHFVHFTPITTDHVLSSVFGGFFLGVGIGLSIRGNAVLDGTEIAALLLSKRSATLRVGDIILGFNVVLFFVAIFLLGVDSALYSMLTYFTASKTLDFILYGIEEYTSFTIISSRPDEIRKAILEQLGVGTTILRGQGGMNGEERKVLLSVVTRLEIGRLKTLIAEYDPDAFYVYHPLADAEGGVFRKKRSH